jgi:hypothetical protein
MSRQSLRQFLHKIPQIFKKLNHCFCSRICMQSLCISDATSLPGSYLDTIFQFFFLKTRPPIFPQRLQLCNFSKISRLCVTVYGFKRVKNIPTVFEKKTSTLQSFQISSSVCIFFNVFRRVSVSNQKKFLIFIPKTCSLFMKNFAQAYLVKLGNSRAPLFKF